MKNLKKLIIISVLIISCALTACSKPSNPAVTGADEKTEGEVFNSSQSDFSDTEETTSEETTSEETTPVNLPPETTEEETYNDLWRPSFDDPVFLDQELLKTVEEDKPSVTVYLYLDEEAAISEYKETYPNILNDPLNWSKFLTERADKIVREVESDYGIKYVGAHIWGIVVSFSCNIDKETISLLLNDPRVIGIDHLFSAQ